MVVKMVHRLTGGSPAVRHDPKTLVQFLFVSQIPRHLLDAPEDLDVVIRGGRQPRNVLSGYDQNMGRRLGVDVPKSDDVAVLEDDLGGYFLPDDLTE